MNDASDDDIVWHRNRDRRWWQFWKPKFIYSKWRPITEWKVK